MSKKFLVVLLVVAMAIPVLSVAGPSAAQNMTYNEAPMLAEKVAAGELPPVEERLPENPRVIGFDDSEIGVYGGIWNRAWRGITDFHCYGRVNYEPTLRWPRDPNDPVQPGLAERWEWNEDGTELTLYYRKGLKWSDGEPFTVDDVIFWWEYIENDPEITTAVHSEWTTLTELVKVDDSTITLKFSEPNGLAETVGLAFHGMQWPLGFERFGFFAPKHYLEQFHPALTEGATYEDFENAAFDYNVDRPVMTPWKITVYEEGADLMIAERNPYYSGVDKDGNQLPYIDYQYYHLTEEGTTGVNLMGIAGELDMQARSIDIQQFPVYMENADEQGYHMLMWPTASASNVTLWFNQSYDEEKYRELFQTFEFRQAMSLAIDRDTINEIAFLGQGVPRTETVVPDSPYYQEDIENLNGEYNPDEAKRLLEEEVGLVMGDDGFYNFADGSDLLLVMESRWPTGQNADALNLIAEWWSELGVETVHQGMTRDEYWPRAGANEVMVATWGTDRGLVPMVDPIYIMPFDERSWMAPAFGIWYHTGGAEGEEPTAELKESMDLYDLYKVTTDPAEQVEIGKKLVRLSTERLWTIGTVGMVPNPVVVKNNFINVAENHTADWIIMTPGTLEPAHFFFSDGGM
jgi:peptide/nickel transport system substrate-binding protein